VVDFLLVIIKLFCYLLWLRRYKQKSVEVDAFQRVWVGHFERNFQMETASPANHYWCQKTRVIALSCDIKISAVHCFFSTKHMCDEQTDGQNYDS